MKMVVMCVALGVLAGCGPSMRGPLVRPPPVPVLRPGHGLPTYHPTQPQVEREPNPKPERVLPQTDTTRKEPGIWAAHAPVVAPMLAKVLLPLPDDSGEHDVMAASHCGGSMDLSIQWGAKDDAVKSLTNEERRCLAAWLYRFCADHLLPNRDAAKALREAAVRKSAKAFEKSSCTDAMRKAGDDIFGRATAMWTEMNMHAMRDQ